MSALSQIRDTAGASISVSPHTGAVDHQR